MIRIVRLIAQYFYPQPQVKLMNEGCATWVHQRIMTRLHETGQIDDAAFLEVLHSTSNVIMQPGFDHPAGGPGFNPYALGYAMMTDIARVCEEPTAEDRRWFPDIAGNRDPIGTLRQVWAEYRDESFRAAVFVAEGDPRLPDVPAAGRLGRADAAGRRDP